MSESKKVDPGWNDPPMLNYSASHPPPKSRIANKRVPFPLGSSPVTQKPTLPSAIGPSSSDSLEEAIPNMADVTFANFNSVLNSEASADLVEKIKLMEEMWRSGKFPTNLKNDLYKLSNSIVQKDHKTATALHFEINMKYHSYCKDWIQSFHKLCLDK